MHSMKEAAYESIRAHLELTQAMDALIDSVCEVAQWTISCLRSGGRLLLCGNGGSAADAQHLAAEFSGRFLKDREPWDAIALHCNTSALTAVGNDYSFDEIFSREVRAHGRPGDIIIGLSTSGNSPNVIRAFEVAWEKGMKTIGLTGIGGGMMAAHSDLLIAVPSGSTPRIQEMHIMIGHIICFLVEEEMCRQHSGAHGKVPRDPVTF